MPTDDRHPTPERPSKSLVTQPALVFAFVATVASEWTLPLQYRPVLFRDDLEMLALSCSLVVGGITYASYRRARRAGVFQRRWLLEAASVALAAFAVGAVSMRFVPHSGVTGIGSPRAWVVGMVVLWATACGAAGAAVGLRHRWRWWVRVPLTMVVVLAAVVALAVASQELKRQPRAVAEGRCVDRSGVTYCHYAGYRPFVDDWRIPVDAVLAELPEKVVASRELIVRQGTEEHADLDAIATPLLRWSPSSTARLALALDTANSFLGINDDYKTGERGGSPGPGLSSAGCGPGGDSGRMVVSWWLAGQVDDATRRQVIEMPERDPAQDALSGSGYAQGVGGGPTALASQLLERDDAEVGRIIRAHWAELTSPTAGVDPIMTLFDLEAEDGVGLPAEPEDRDEVPAGCPPAPRR